MRGVFSLKGHMQGLDHRIWILFYGRIATATGFSLVIPFLSMYLHQDLGISMSLVGLILLMTSLIGSMGQIIGGELADRLGRKRVMTFALIWRTGAFLLISLAIGAGAGYLTLAALVTLSSFGGSLFDPASNAMVADVVEPSKRLEAYGLLRVGQNIGWAAGPMIGGLLSSWLSFSAMFSISAVATAAVALLLYHYIQESLRKDQVTERFRLRDLGHVTRDGQFMLFCLVSISIFIMFGQMSSTYAVFGTETVGVSKAEMGYLWAWNGVMVVALQFPIARWISHYRMSSMMVLGSLLYAGGYGIVGLAGDIWFLVLNMTILTFGEMVVSPASMNIVAGMSPEKERGRYMGVFGLTTSMGFALGPFMGGLIMDGLVGNDLAIWAAIGSFGLVAAIGFFLIGFWTKEGKEAITAS